MDINRYQSMMDIDFRYQSIEIDKETTDINFREKLIKIDFSNVIDYY